MEKCPSAGTSRGDRDELGSPSGKNHPDHPQAARGGGDTAQGGRNEGGHMEGERCGVCTSVLGQRWAHTGVLYWGCAGDCWDISGGSAGAVLGSYWWAVLGQCWGCAGGLYWVYTGVP